MDVVRSQPARRFRLPFVPLAFLAAAAAGGGGYLMLHSLHAAAPTVDRATLVIDRARVMSLDRTVRASGTLAVHDVRVVATTEDGTVAELTVRAGSRVAPDTVIARLRSETIEAALADANAKLRAALAERESALAGIGTAQLVRDTAVVKAEAAERQAAVQAQTDASLYQQGFIGALPYRLAQIAADEAKREAALAKRTRPAGAADDRARLAIADAEIAGARAAVAALQARADALVLRAGMSGVVQSVSVEPGQRLPAGAVAARVGSERDLEAVVAVPESQVRDVSLGASAAVSGPGGLMHGRVTHVDPASQNGSVPVEIALDGPLPDGARPDVAVDAAIFVERLGRVLTIARPANAADESAADVFKLSADGHSAVRTRVRLGRGPLDRVAVLAGLAPGDQIIVSDMSAYDGRSGVRIP
jgi:multidrug efflux pump subunit AcrA (membrane-fusion protein)